MIEEKMAEMLQKRNTKGLYIYTYCSIIVVIVL